METSTINSILIADFATEDFIEDELLEFIKLGIPITLNTHHVLPNILKDINLKYKNKINFVSFHRTDQKSLINVIEDKKNGFSVIKTAFMPMNRDVILQATSSALKNPLKIIAQPGVGVDHIDCSAATEFGVIILNAPGANSNAVAELVIACMLSLSRHLCVHNRESHKGVWSKGLPNLTHVELAGKKLGLIGIGNISRSVIPKAKAFGMQVLGFSDPRFFTEQDAHELGIKKCDNLDELLSDSNYVSLHIPLNEQTKNFIGLNELKKMKKNSFLINAARGGLVDENALADELRKPERNISGAAIDTFVHELSDFQSPLIGVENVILTPHVGGISTNARLNAVSILVDSILSNMR